MNRHIVIPEPGKVVVEDAPMPVPAADEALLKVLYGGICGSDLGTYRGTYAYVDYPRVPGHELAVEILEVGPNEFGLKPGMLATVNPYTTCGQCYPCESGLDNCCIDNKTLGCARDGAFMLYTAQPVGKIYPVEGLGPRETALIEPFCISYHGVSRAGVKPGEKVLIIGSGTIGILAMLAAKHHGGEVFMADVAPGKLELARKLGADGTFVNGSRDEFAAWVRDVTAGRGFPVVIEAVGLPATFQDCLDAVAFSGRVVIIGISKTPIKDFNFMVIQKKELAVYGSRNASRQDFMDVMDMMRATGLDADTVVTNTYDFEDAPRAWADFDRHSGEMLKVLLRFP